MPSPPAGIPAVMEREHSAADRRFRAFAESGDPRALGEVYDLLAPELLRIALHTSRDAAEAEDVLQATFVVAIERAKAFDPAQRVRPWLVGILANEARKARARAARSVDPRDVARAAQANPEDEAERAELLALLDSALARVPEAFRPVLQLRLRHGLSIPEIAAALGRPSGTVRSQLARGTECLRRALPAGLAGVLAGVAAPTRGLAAVRDAVLEEACALHGPLAISTVLGGVLAVKPLVALSAVLVAAWCWWGLSTRQPARPEAPPLAGSLREAPLDPDRAVEPPMDDLGDVIGALTSGARREAVAAAPAAEESPAVEASGSLLVHARWSDGSPAEGEIVLATPRTSREDEALAVRTEPNGTARFSDLAPGPVNVRLLRGGQDTARVSQGREAQLTLRIQGGVTVEGRVSDGHGQPLEGAEIWLSERYRGNLGHAIAVSGAGGAFTVRDVGPDQYLGARKHGFAPSELRSLRGQAGDRLSLELVLARAGALARGIVLDANGAPVPGASVLLGDECPPAVRLEIASFAPGPPPQRARTDADGRFEVGPVAVGLQPLQVRGRGFAPFAASFEVLEAGLNELSVVLEPEARVIGTVRDPLGEPIAGAWVHTGQPELFGQRTTFSGLDGRFELDGLGRDHAIVRAEHLQGHASAERALHLAPGETFVCDVVLAPSPRIEGQVVDARGSPLAGLVVIALPEGYPERPSRGEPSDAGGRFSLSGLEDCTHRVWVQSPLGWRDFPLAELTGVEPGGPPLVLRVGGESECGRLALEVAAPDGRPVLGAELQVWHVERRLWRSFGSGGERGAILAANVPPGTLELELRHPEHPWKRLGEHRLEAGATLDLGRVVLDPAGSLRVHLGGDVAESASLVATLTDSSNRESGVARIEPGLLTAGPLASGEHLLVLGGDGVCQVRTALRIEAGVETELRIMLEPCPRREVRFITALGADSPGWVACSLRDASGALVWSGNADCTKTPPSALVSAPMGTYRLMVGGDRGLTGDGELSISDASEGPFEVLLRPGP